MITDLGNNKYLYPSVKAGSLESVRAGGTTATFEPKLDFACFNDLSAKVGLNLNALDLTEPVKDAETLIVENSKLRSLWLPTGIKPGFNERGGFDWQVTLFEEPFGRYLNFDLDLTNLIAYHQPELTAKEIADGAVRPEHVVNSIALYHASKGGLVTASNINNYITTGKAGHLYNMLCIDAGGEKVYGAWTLEAGSQARFHIPKGLKYPVILAPVGDTFGYTSVGASTDEWPGGRLRGSSYQAPADADLDSITVRQDLYSGSDNLKGVLVNSSKAIMTNGVGGAVAMTTSPAWVTSTFGAKPSVTNGTSYFLMFIHAGGDGIYAYDTGAANQGLYDTSNNYTTPTDPTDGSSDTRKYSVYATYTAGEAPSAVLKTKHQVIIAE